MKRLIFFVCLLYLVIPLVSAGNLNIVEDSISFDILRGNCVEKSFNIENLNSSTLENISFIIPNPLEHNSYIIDDITINNGQNLNLALGESKPVLVRICTSPSLIVGSYSGTILASLSGLSDTLMVNVDLSVADVSPPIVISHSPMGIVPAPGVNLVVVTNEEATCKYSQTAGISYENLDYAFSQENTISHNRPQGNLVDGFHHYYIKCKDALGNTAIEDYDASFTVDSSPSAEIILGSSPPLKAGKFKVTLESSEPLMDMPVLTYSLDGKYSAAVPLEGSGTSWSGYMIITESQGERIGSFSFLGKDYSGRTGNVITKGKIFLVDTVPPLIVNEIDVKNKEDGSVLIEWYYNSEISYFNIYRSASSDVSYTDYYKKVTNKAFRDMDIDPGKTYYYRVAAVDDAENEGKLSPEVSTTSLRGGVNLAEDKIKLDLNLMGDVDKYITQVNDLRETIASLNTKFSGEDSEGIISGLGIFDRLSNEDKDLVDMISELESFKEQDSSETELSKKLARIELSLKIAKKNIPESLSILEEKSSKLSSNEEELKSFIDFVFSPGSQSELESLVKENKKNLDKIDVSVDAKSFRINYLDGSNKDVAFVKHVIVSELEDVELYLEIPKELAETTNLLSFNNKEFKIVKEDPVVKFGVVEEIVYIIDNNVDLSHLTSINVFPIGVVEPASGTGLIGGTGWVSIGDVGLKDNLGYILGGVLLIGLMLYYLLFVKFNFKLPNIKRKNDKLESLISDADSLLKKGLIDPANEVYQNILNDYGSRVSDKDYSKVSALCSRLDLEFLKQNLRQVNVLINSGNHASAKERFSDLGVVYERLGKNHKSEVDQVYSELSNKLNL